MYEQELLIRYIENSVKTTRENSSIYTKDLLSMISKLIACEKDAAYEKGLKDGYYLGLNQNK